MHDGWLRSAEVRWVRREEADDRAAIRTVNIEAFERENEADLVDALREESATFLSFVAGEAFMLLELVPGGLQGLSGTVVYPGVFRSAM